MKTAPKFKAGDLATWTIYSDSRAGRIIKATAKSVLFQEDKATLLNPPGSGEPDAMSFSAGGFVGHTSGQQRWDCQPDPTGAVVRFSLRTRKNGDQVWKARGSSTHSAGQTLRAGHSHHYDFNF